MKMLVSALVMFCLWPSVGWAKEIQLVDEVMPYSVITVGTDPEVARAYYGELRNAPDTYEFTATEDFTLFVQVAAPDIANIDTAYNGIIVKVLPRGGVVEVARLPSGSVTWREDYDFWRGEAYLLGPSYTGELSAGTYRVEVSTPDNHGKYVLFMGTKDVASSGIFGTLSNIAAVKDYYGYTPLAVLRSPYYCLLALLLVGVGYWLRRRHTQGLE